MMTLRTPHRHIYYDGPQDGRTITNEHAPLVVDFITDVRPQAGDSVLHRLQGKRERLVDRYMLESKVQDVDGVFVCRYRYYKTMPVDGDMTC